MCNNETVDPIVDKIVIVPGTTEDTTRELTHKSDPRVDRITCPVNKRDIINRAKCCAEKLKSTLTI